MQKHAKRSGGYRNCQVQGPHLKRQKPFEDTNVRVLQGRMKTKSSQGHLPVILTGYVYCTSETRSITFTEHNAFGRKSTGITTTPTCTVKVLGTHNTNTMLPWRLRPSWWHVFCSHTTPFTHTIWAWWLLDNSGDCQKASSRSMTTPIPDLRKQTWHISMIHMCANMGPKAWRETRYRIWHRTPATPHLYGAGTRDIAWYARWSIHTIS